MACEALNDVLSLYKSEMYDEALREIKRLELTVNSSAPLFVIKGKLLQLAEGDLDALTEAKKAFLQAIECDRYCISAILELAWLELSALQEIEAATEHFNRALALANQFRDQAIEGIRSCAE